MKKLLVACIACIMSSGAFAALCWHDNGNGTKTCKEGGLACTSSSDARCSVDGETAPTLVGNGAPRTPPKAAKEKVAEGLHGGSPNTPAATPAPSRTSGGGAGKVNVQDEDR